MGRGELSEGWRIAVVLPGVECLGPEFAAVLDAAQVGVGGDEPVDLLGPAGRVLEAADRARVKPGDGRYLLASDWACSRASRRTRESQYLIDRWSDGWSRPKRSRAIVVALTGAALL